MAVVTTWWKPEDTGSFKIPREQLAARGAFGGPCFHVTCQHTGADWFNKQDRRYYCDAHARALNEQCLHEGLPKVCELHL